MTSSSTHPAPTAIRNRWALLVGVNHYSEDFSPLKFCVNDVQALTSILRQLEYTVVCMHDELARDDDRFPTRNNVEAELTRLCQTVGPDDLLWVHFACHGTLIEQEPVLVMRDTRHATLARTALPLTDVERLMRDSQANRLVLTLDACHTGVEIGRDIADPEFIHNAYETAQGFALIAASTTQQVAQEWQEVEHGVFTYYLLKGLIGKADQANKRFVTVNDLQIYVVDHLRRWNVEWGGRIQQPTFRADGRGDLILADYREIQLQSTNSVSQLSQPISSQPVTRSVTRQQFLKWFFLGGIGLAVATGVGLLRQVDYSTLESFLKAKQWKEADQETLNIMLKETGREQAGSLNLASIKNFPCDVLSAIDQLWLRYSGNQFGFSVQRKIWQDVGRPIEHNAQWEEFGNRVGWRINNEWTVSSATYKTEAPRGHLPFSLRLRNALDQSMGEVFSSSLILRTESCGI